jgi:hypothetical protein
MNDQHERGPGAVPRDFPDQQAGSTTQPDLWEGPDLWEREEAAEDRDEPRDLRLPHDRPIPDEPAD